jgi:hypothetical protein
MVLDTYDGLRKVVPIESVIRAVRQYLLSQPNPSTLSQHALELCDTLSHLPIQSTVRCKIYILVLHHP